MPPWKLRLCGEAALTAPGDDTPARRVVGKTLALLAVLALERRAHTREALTALLWGEYPEEKARMSFRQALTRLRAVLGDLLRIDRRAVELRGALPSDVADFLELAARDPGAATSIDIPAFLAGLSLSQAPAFDEWADARRAELLLRFRGVLEWCTRDAMSRRDWRRAVDMAARWSALDPLDEQAVAALTETHFLAGDATAALDVHRKYRSRLQTVKGRRPGRDLDDLVARIRRAAESRREGRTEASRAAVPSFTAGLVGRGREWQALAQSWSMTTNGESAIAVIEGEPGIGKTRLAEDYLRCVVLQGGVVLRGRCYDASPGTSYGTVMDVIRSAMDAPGLAGLDPQWLGEMVKLVPELRTRFPGLPASDSSAGSEAWRVLEAICQAMLAIAEEGNLAVFVDDLQWCDAESCSMLHALVRRLDATPLFWCATYTPGVAERDSPSSRLVRALRASRRAVSLCLSPLGEDDVWCMVRDLARINGRSGARRLAARIHEVTGGNPFYVIELLRTLFAQGVLAVDEPSGAWMVRTSVLEEAEPLVLAPSVHEAVGERIASLPEELAAVLITLAVAGRGCRTDILSHVHGISRLRAAALGDRLVERHLAVDEDGRYCCAHPVIAQVVRDGLTSSRRHEVHRALALSLELLLTGEPDAAVLGEVAHHAERAGERALACRFALRAVDACSRHGGYEESWSWLELAARAAGTAEEVAEVERLREQIVDRAGRRLGPPALAGSPLPWPRVGREDLDLPSG